MRGSVRLVRKTGGINEKFKGRSLDTIWEGMSQPLTCKYCGQPMVPYRDHANVGIWRCNTSCCVNNPDEKFSFDMDAEFIRGAGNVLNTWDHFVPRRIL